MHRTTPARLELEDGSSYEGRAFGAALSTSGEVVFTTGMAGYPQSLSDPSYRGQILVSTYPLAGNYGVPVDPRTMSALLDERGVPLHLESERVQVSGLVVSEACERPSHHASGATLSAWLEASGVPGIAGVDTRALAQRLRERGTMRGAIVVGGHAGLAEAGTTRSPEAPACEPGREVAEASPRGVRVYEAAGAERAPRIVLVDCGAKANLLRCLLSRGATVIRVPWDHDLSGIEHDGLFLSNGPGDPKACAKTIAAARRALRGDKPIFGVCLGNQILALAAGADTYKLPYGHRGQNQPCVELGTGRCHITSQNHGYAVKEDSLPRGWEPWFRNANDGTLEGVASTEGPFRAVQFHPEGCPGPRDTEYLIDGFLGEVRARARLGIAERETA
ncbi:MAG: glutamine-hydrolyzing carbamoyl-phosphate synthase small subunit [Spirochaetes bacterium]|nr:glutamine-hydrolyzing carbamoyl-phosphate synthase small subunit [Spirochaetota bacterium]MBU1082401.1 glutamine-hydrolyzing carbamoyl-phosphate synthase small subunit [Spirochaetota bacterium]